MTKEEFEEIYKNNKEIIDTWPKNYPYWCQTVQDFLGLIELSKKNYELGKEMMERYQIKFDSWPTYYYDEKTLEKIKKE